MLPTASNNTIAVNEGDLRAARLRYLREVVPRFFEQWHWFQYHFSKLPPTKFGQDLIDTCIRLDHVSPDLGLSLLTQITRIGGGDRDWNDYDQILQKMAEMLVIDALRAINWPATTKIAIEGKASGSNKRVDCIISTPSQTYGVEIKSPALLVHRKNRSQNPTQLPGRVFSRDHIERLGPRGEGITLPRDNPIFDFLVSSNAKFEAFKREARESFTGILAIVWDDFIYEPITTLLHEHFGLLTKNSYKRVGERAQTFPFVDAVILVRHLTYFTSAAAEERLPDGREHAFHIGGRGALPNVFIPVAPNTVLPELILRGLWAWPHDDPALKDAAEYRPLDLVWWHEYKIS
jgi:hypothetical protein